MIANKYIVNSVFVFYGLQLFMAPLSIAGSSIAAGLFLVMYILSGFWKNWRAVLGRVWFWPAIGLLLLTLGGMFWTDDVNRGRYIVTKIWHFLFLFLGASLPWTRQRFKFLPVFFISGLGLNAIVGALQWFDLYHWHPMIPGDGPVGYSNHVYLSTLLAAALIWIMYDIKHQVVMRRPWAILCGSILLLDLVVSNGRTGQVAFLLLFPASLLMLSEKRMRFLLSIAAISISLMIAFTPMVQQRFMIGIEDLSRYQQGEVMTSLGLRLVFWEGALKMAAEHPFFGVGTGGYRSEIIRLQNHGEIPKTPGLDINVIEPHNSYLAYVAELGLLGLSFFLWFLYSVAREAWSTRATPEGWLHLSLLGAFMIGSLFDAFNWIWSIMIPFLVVTGMPAYIPRSSSSPHLKDGHGVPDSIFQKA